MKPKLLLTWAVLLSVAFTTQLHAELLDPLDFTSLGTFNVTNGGYIIDTDAVTITETNGVSTNLLFTGVIDDQGGQADSFGPGGSVTNVGPLGIPHIAVFTFDELVLDGTATFTVTGHRALALLSHGNALINVALSLNGKVGARITRVTTAPGVAAPGAGGAGGFAGGAAGRSQSTDPIIANPGEGPGGGPEFYDATAYPRGAASGSFGSVGLINSSSLTGVAYGNLTVRLQGGSGGGGLADLHNPLPYVYTAGSGGGGALEIVAVGFLNIDSAASLKADGARGIEEVASYYDTQGAGSGGGIRLAGRDLVVTGSVTADSKGFGGGGRIFLRGLVARYQAGSEIGSVLPASVSVVSLSNNIVPEYRLTSNAVITNRVLQGHVHVEMGTFDIPTGMSYELASVESQAATTNQPAVGLIARDVAVEGTLTVPAGGITYPYRIELRGPVARITGADPLALTAPLSGEGSVQVPLAVLTGGSISVGAGQELASTQPVTNVAGTLINNIAGTLTFAGDGNGATDDGLVNRGTLNLINAVVNGDVRSPAGSTNNVAGSATFNGHFKGAASFSGTQNLVTFNGGYEPGDSPAAVSFGGSVAFGAGGTPTLELGGISAGTHYDQLNVNNTVSFAGTLEVVLINGFVPAAGQVFQLFNAANRVGSFATVSLPALGVGLGWTNRVAVDGSIAVIAVPASVPQFDSLILSGVNLIFSGTGGASNESYVLVSSTNVAEPLSNWQPVLTNLFDGAGSFLFTNAINPNHPQEFYRLFKP